MLLPDQCPPIAHSPSPLLPGSSPCQYWDRNILWHLPSYRNCGSYWIFLPQVQEEKPSFPALQGRWQVGTWSRGWTTLPQTHCTSQIHNLQFLQGFYARLKTLITSRLSCSDRDTEEVRKAHRFAWGMRLQLPSDLSTQVSAHTDISNTKDWPKAYLTTPQQCRSLCLPRKLTLKEAGNYNHWKGTCPPLLFILFFWRLKHWIGKRPDPKDKQIEMPVELKSAGFYTDALTCLISLN